MRDTRRQQEWNYLKLQSCPALCLEGQQSCERHPVIGERGRKKKADVQDDWGMKIEEQKRIRGTLHDWVKLRWGGGGNELEI